MRPDLAREADVPAVIAALASQRPRHLAGRCTGGLPRGDARLADYLHAVLSTHRAWRVGIPDRLSPAADDRRHRYRLARNRTDHRPRRVDRDLSLLRTWDQRRHSGRDRLSRT